jgi:hypothetical protein
MLLRVSVLLALAVRASALYFLSPQSAVNAHRPDADQALLGTQVGGDAKRVTPFPPPVLQDVVRPVLATLSEAELREDLWGVTSFRTRCECHK